MLTSLTGIQYYLAVPMTAAIQMPGLVMAIRVITQWERLVLIYLTNFASFGYFTIKKS